MDSTVRGRNRKNNNKPHAEPRRTAFSLFSASSASSAAPRDECSYESTPARTIVARCGRMLPLQVHLHVVAINVREARAFGVHVSDRRHDGCVHRGSMVEAAESTVEHDGNTRRTNRQSDSSIAAPRAMECICS